MLRRIASRSSPIAAFQARMFFPMGPTDQSLIPTPYFHVTSRSFLDLHKMTNKEAIEKEKARLSDELSRGYFADIAEMRQNGGEQSGLKSELATLAGAEINPADTMDGA